MDTLIKSGLSEEEKPTGFVEVKGKQILIWGEPWRRGGTSGNAQRRPKLFWGAIKGA